MTHLDFLSNQLYLLSSPFQDLNCKFGGKTCQITDSGVISNYSHSACFRELHKSMIVVKNINQV